MKNKFKHTIVTLLVTLVFTSSCTIQKRVYLSGYHISSQTSIKNKAKFKERKKNGKKENIKIDIQEELHVTTFASTNNYLDSFLENQSYNTSTVTKHTNDKDCLTKKSRKTKKSKGLPIAKTQNLKTLNYNVRHEKSKEEDLKQKSERRAAIIKGGAIILMAILAGISLPVLGTLTASIGLVGILLLDVLIALSINKYYRKRKPKLAKTTGFLRLLYASIFGIGIGYHIVGDVAMFTQFWQIGLIGFGLHLIALGILFNNEGGKKWVNAVIKSLLIIAGVGYLIANIGLLLVPNPIAFAALMENIFIAPQILGEMLFALWMIFKGGRNKTTTEYAK